MTAFFRGERMSICDYINDEIYTNRHGSCAFFAGALSAATDCLAQEVYKAGVKFEALSSDVFCIESYENVNIKGLLFERMKKYYVNENIEDKLNNELDKLVINESGLSFFEAVFSCYKDRIDSDITKIEESVKEYCNTAEYYLGKVKKVCISEKGTVEMDGVIARAHCGIAFSYIFIIFDKHLLMFVHGSSE